MTKENERDRCWTLLYYYSGSYNGFIISAFRDLKTMCRATFFWWLSFAEICLVFFFIMTDTDLSHSFIHLVLLLNTPLLSFIVTAFCLLLLFVKTKAPVEAYWTLARQAGVFLRLLVGRPLSIFSSLLSDALVWHRRFRVALSLSARLSECCLIMY